MSEEAEFEFIRQWAKSEASLDILPMKRVLVEMNLKPVIKKNGMNGLGELISNLKKTKNGKLYNEVLDALTTHETSFFRNSEPFDYLREKLFPELLKMRLKTNRIGIWSAACSTGQEIYSVAMIIHEYFPQFLNFELELYATDISEDTLTKARRGEYNSVEVSRGLPVNFKQKYFTECEKNKWVIKDDIRKMVTFKNLNLSDPWPNMAPFHVIFLRNVLIYFDAETKKKILKKLEVYLKRDGILMLGNSESIQNLSNNWTVKREANVALYHLTGF
jgi:chemotaxis protein methyltransferase CheR